MLASSTEMDSEPFQGLVHLSPGGDGPAGWVLAMGDGTAWKTTPAFAIPSGRAVTVEISYAAPGLDITVDGKIIFHSADFAIFRRRGAAQYWRLVAHMFRTDAPTDSPIDTKYQSPNYGKSRIAASTGISQPAPCLTGR